MKLIVGLGNPGSQYLATRHNIGFITIDQWGKKNHVALDREQFQGFYGTYHHQGEKILVVKPMTYMNRSGLTVGLMADYYQIDPSDILVVYDDMDLDVGQIRLRYKGSAGGHNGMKDIIRALGTQEIKRVKIGVGRPAPNQSVVDHVLSNFPKDTHEQMLQAVNHATDAIDHWIDEDNFTTTMSRFNVRT
ncbi:aminoacyl-tRNA hydrolase [Atopobacter phocae]|uniref:aminoacyl-tRNA hydrolase n=1 Tax=Atopobacter phocae TaxID=136492 RepID=UPI000471C7B7|nr:aminoacyl-tRNA hydrolase [Atopobacter phocae]